MDTYLQFSSQAPIEFLTLVNLLRYRAFCQAEKIAYTFLQDGEQESDILTYKQLDLRARTIGAYFQSLKLVGERALLLYPPGLDFITAFLGCLYAPVIAVPVYPQSKRNQAKLKAIIADAQATVALTTTSELSKIDAEFVQYLESEGIQLLTTDNITDKQASDWCEPILNKSSLAFLQYTSGSTAAPKGVMVSHGNLLHNLNQIQQYFEHTSDSRGVIWLPPYHDMGLIGGILQALYACCPSTLMSPIAFLQKPLRWLQAITRYKATTSGAPNFAYDLAVSQITSEQRATLDLSSWDVAFIGAEPVVAQTLERFANTFADCGFRREAFYPCYGMAEATLIVSGGWKTQLPVVSHVKETALQQRVVEVGEGDNTKAVIGCGTRRLDQKIVIVDPESLIQCPPGKVGEIWVSSPSVAVGYWGKPEETKQTFQAVLAGNSESFLRTGDLGFLQNGELFVTGRLKDLIIIRGKNYYPQDIELTVSQSHQALRPNCGAAFSIEAEDAERLVIIYEIERSYLRQINVDEVIGAIRKAVSEQHELQVYAVVLLKTASIPKTSSGKIQRYLCRSNFLNGSLDSIGNWSVANSQKDSLQLQTELEPHITGSKPLTVEAIEQWLISHLAVYLKVLPEDIDIREPFTYYGLDSSVAVSTTSKLGEWLGYELEPTLFWEYPSITAVAEYLGEKYSFHY